MKTLNTLLATGILAGALTGCQTTVNTTKAHTSEILTSPTLVQGSSEEPNVYDVLGERTYIAPQEFHIM